VTNANEFHEALSPDQFLESAPALYRYPRVISSPEDCRVATYIVEHWFDLFGESLISLAKLVIETDSAIFREP
jgi:hypothetical protein